MAYAKICFLAFKGAFSYYVTPLWGVRNLRHFVIQGGGGVLVKGDITP